jgi:ABC-type Fe3+/spermidine/putrescine transport system ATPase subunit
VGDVTPELKLERRGADGAPPASAVRARGITKQFPGVVANDGVDFEAAVGEVHALLGENGAGKSTLSNILTGLYRPDAGDIHLYGRPVEFHTPREALDAGICMVHQHFRLVEPFSVAENVVLGDHRGEGKAFRLHPRRIERRVAELSKRILTSALKKTDVGVYKTVSRVATHHWKGNADILFSLKNNGVGVAIGKGGMSPKVKPAWIKLMNQYKARILKGKLKPPSCLNGTAGCKHGA